MLGHLLARETLNVPCKVEVENTSDFLFTNVDLQGHVEIGPGDEVTVLGDPIVVPFGERQVLDRRAEVVRASPLQRALTRVTGRFEFMELLEFSFSSGRRL